MQYIGVDGCRAGWFWVTLSDTRAWAIGLAPDAEALAALAAGARLMLIDVPIGLPDSGFAERLCDREARAVLGRPRAASVFRVPARSVLQAPNYAAASQLNRRLTGAGVSRQTWGIAPKIRDIDRLLQARPALREILRETHPEVCFWALNHARAMRHNKKTAAGRRERLVMLRRFFPDVERLLEHAATRYLRKQVALDDILDATVLAVTAKQGAGRYLILPARPARDAAGLPMEMLYCTP